MEITKGLSICKGKLYAIPEVMPLGCSGEDLES